MASADFRVKNGLTVDGNATLAGTSLNLGTSTSALTTATVGGAITGNILKLAGTASGTANITTDVTTGIFNIAAGITTGTVNIATGGASTTNIGGAAASLTVGTTSGNSTLTISGNATSGSATLTTNSGVTTANIFNTNATTINAFGAGTAIGIGTNTGYVNIYNPTIRGSYATQFFLNGTSPSIKTTSTGTASVFNDTALTGNLFAESTTVNIGYTGSSTAATYTQNYSTGYVGSGATKTINIGTAGIGFSTTNVNIGSNFGGTTTFGTPTININISTGNYQINGTSVLNATTLGSNVVNSSLTTVGTIGTGVWNGTIITGTYGGTGVNNGTKTITLGGNLTTSGSFTTTLTVGANTNVTLPASGTLVGSNDSQTVTNTMLAGSIANTKLTNSTISGIALGSNLSTLTIGTGLTGTSYNGSTGVTIAIDNTVALKGDVIYIGSTGISLNRTSANLGLTGITSIDGYAAGLAGGNATTLLGALPYQSAANTTSLLSPNITATKKFLRMTGDGTNGTAPAWDTIVAGDIPSHYIGTTSITFNRSSAAQSLTGITSIDGSAATLTTARNINGVAFNGSADITVTAAAGTLTGATLASGVTASSLTSVGTLSSLTVTGGNYLISPNTNFSAPGTLDGSAMLSWSNSVNNAGWSFSGVDNRVFSIILGGNNHVTIRTAGNLDVIGNLLPYATTTYNLGSTTLKWATMYGVASSANYADLAERYTADEDYEPGTVLDFGGANEVTISNTDMSRKIAGIVSTNPGYLMNAELESEFVVTLALTGRVPCKVQGAVRKGDMMVSASNGYARAEEDPKLGSVIGKALEDFDGITGVIEVVVGRL